MPKYAIYVQKVPWVKVIVEAKHEEDALDRLEMEGDIIKVDAESIEVVADDTPTTKF